MRIGMMADVYKPHVSGITHHISLNKRVMEQAGHKVFVFTFGDLDYEDEELRVVRSPGVPLADTGYYFAFRYTRVARRKLQSMDVVHVHHPFLSGRLALRYCRPHRIPVVFTNHTRYDLYAQAYLPMLPDQVGHTFLLTYLPSFAEEVDLVIAPSEGVKRVMRDLGVEAHIEVIPNGVDLAPFREKAEPVPRSSLGLSSDDVVLVYTGRLGPEKNLTFLLRAFAGARSAYPKAALLLLGDGPERDNLQHLAEKEGIGDRVIFTGMVPYDTLPSYLATADLFVTASVTEVHPLSLIEALAAGLPVLGIDSPGVGDTVEDGQNGLLSPHDLAAYTAKLTRLLAEPALRRELASMARRSAEKYDIHRTSALLLEQYQRLVASPPRREGRPLQYFWQRLVDRLT